MSFKIELGLFALDFADYHAILGVPVDASTKDIRKHYLMLARRLHPDSCAKESQEDRQNASEFLSKLVNPAYEKLSQEKNYSEYLILLRLKGQQALRQQDTIMLVSESARKLAAASDVEYAYKTAVKLLADKQYEHLNRTLDITGQISELNLVYLMRTNGKVNVGAPTAANRPAATGGATASAEVKQPPTQPAKSMAKAPQTLAQLVEACLRRASDFEKKQNYSQAILELREAIKINPRSGEAHSRLAAIYLKSNQPTMAKIHFNKALELNPDDAIAKDGLARLNPSSATAKKASSTAKPAAKPGSSTGNPKASGDNTGKSSGGLFGLFGGKKK